MKQITNPARSDGMFAQYQTIICAALFSSLNNLEFVYTPFNKIEHNYNNDPEFNEKMENLINFKNNFKQDHSGLQAKQQNILPIQALISFFELNINQCLKDPMFLKIKELFYLNKKNPFNDKQKKQERDQDLNIAIHIRRNNEVDNKCGDTNLQQRYLPDDVFVSIIKHFITLYGSSVRGLHIHIYSQGPPENFKVFQDIDPRVLLHLDEDLSETFISLVFANILVISPSSMSYVAGLLSNGSVYGLSFWHKFPGHWTSIHYK